MQCDRARELLGAFQDGELLPDDRRAVSLHLQGCAACSERLADDVRIARSVRQLGRSPAGPALATRVGAMIERAEFEVPGSEAGVASGARGLSGPLARITSYAASLAAACAVTAMVTWWLVSASNQLAGIGRDVAAAHIRSLMQDSQTQVASSDHHTVKPWFAGRSDFAPDVKDLSAEGFQLIGGRLDYVADRRVVAAVYKRRLHVINVFMWPSTTAAIAAPQLATRNGYNLLSWTRDGVAFWIASDLNAQEVRLLQQLL